MSNRLFAFFSSVIFTAAILLALCLEADAAEAGMTRDEAESKVVLVVADYLGIEDINNMDFLGRLAADSHLALMNNRQPGKAGAAKSKLILGSGKRLEFGADMSSGGSDESGRVSKSGSLVYTDLNKLIKRNAESEYREYIGYLGEAIKRNNGATCFLGNSDTETGNRSSMLIAMDGNGEIDLGETESILKEDKLFPYGRRTDYNKLAELYKQYLPASSFIVIETGDMERLEAFRDSMAEGYYETYKADVLTDIDSFIGELIRYGGFKTLLLISSYPSKSDAEAGSKLTPVVVFDTSGGGSLYSENTRREGIILNTDLADYILFKLGYLKSNAIIETKKEDPGSFLKAMNENIVITSVLRLPVLTSYAVMIISAVVMLFVTAVYSGMEYNTRYSWLSSLTAYTMLAFPLALLYLPTSFLGKSAAGYMAFAAAAALAFSLILHITLKEKVRIILTICMLQLISLIVDVFAGSPLIKQSVLGYDPIIGARFYGIGNEYAGMFIGCSLVIFGCVQEISGIKPGKALTAVYFLASTFVLGLALLGANFGGAAAGAAGYLLAYFLIYGIKFNRRNIFMGIFVLCAFAAVLVILDSTGISAPSHLGNLVRDAEVNGLGVITSVIQRKISMNLRLIRYTIWTKVLICIIAAISIMFYRPVKLLRKVFIRHKHLKNSWICVAASAITGFAVNDSGIVLAATAMIYVVFTMLPICIGERNES